MVPGSAEVDRPLAPELAYRPGTCDTPNHTDAQETNVARQAPTGPLLGEELDRAIQDLTDKQLRVYRYRREGHAWNWIAQRMGTSRPAVIHLFAKAEKRLGYEPTVALRQRTPYKSVATRTAEAEASEDARLRELMAQISPARRRRIHRIIESACSDKEAGDRLRKQVQAWALADARERYREEDERWRERRREMGLPVDELEAPGSEPEDETREAQHRDHDHWGPVMEDMGFAGLSPTDLPRDS